MNIESLSTWVRNDIIVGNAHDLSSYVLADDGERYAGRSCFSARRRRSWRIGNVERTRKDGTITMAISTGDEVFVVLRTVDRVLLEVICR